MIIIGAGERVKRLYVIHGIYIYIYIYAQLAKSRFVKRRPR